MIGFLGSLLLAAAPARAADTLVYYNSAYFSSGASTWGQLKSAINAGGGTVTYSTSTAWATSSSSYSSYKLIILILPGASFSSSQASALKSWVNSGGRLVLVGDWWLNVYGVDLGYYAEDGYINDLLSKMGSDMSLGSSPFAYTACDTATSIYSDQVSTGVSGYKVYAGAPVSSGTDVVQYSGNTAVAVDQLSSTSHVRSPYDVVVIGDSTSLTTSTYGGCSGSTTAGYNKTLWENLYTGVLCPDSDGDGYEDDSCGGSDCDDTDATVSPVGTETCNSVDDDCNGTVDDISSGGSRYYPDDDSDGYGDETATYTRACSAPTGYTTNHTDCDDANASINPGESERCNGIDDDCDGHTDENSAIDVVTWYRDSDSDTYGTSATVVYACSAPAGYVASNTDCNDSNSSVYPGATEYCDSLDNDCDGSTDESAVDTLTWYRDSDSDGFGTSSTKTYSCTLPSGYVADSTDCDDTLASVYPGAAEACNGRDDDCDGTVDESDATDALTWYRDADGDTFGDASVTAKGCTTPSGYVSNATDCDDSRGLTNPSATEYCNGYDDDCDGTTDESSAADAATWYTDADGDTYGGTSSTKACSAPSGTVSDHTDCDDGAAAVHPGATEVCNGIDDNCDGVTDPDTATGTTTYYTDADADGFGLTSAPLISCSLPSGASATAGDCDDADAARYPGATEVCDGKDNDCDGVVDDGATDSALWYADDDGDSYGDVGRSVASCTQPIDYVEDDTDCDDTDAAVNPGADEVCNGLDDDCDEAVDEDSAVDALTWWLDEDADGYAGGRISAVACDLPEGYAADADDCDDDNPDIHPDGVEVCNGYDDDCDGAIDGADAVGAVDWYADADADGWGDESDVVTQCDDPGASTGVPGDCDDGNPAVNPDATEVCNGVDDDCNGTVDTSEAVDAVTWYRDHDGDSFGDLASTLVDCTLPSGYSADSTDCDDTRVSVYPGAPETCNTLDDDCDGVVDDGASDARTWYGDADGDAYGDPSVVTAACDAPSGYCADATDCDDTDPATHPLADEIPYDGIDQDCVDGDWNDLDGDGYIGELAGGDDCDDQSATVHPGAAEAVDGIDGDCDGLVDDGTSAWDDDGDGFTESGGDCDDTDDAVHPGAEEAANAADDDCDGLVDEGTSRYDDDGDGYTEYGGDCNDTDAAVHPGAAEVDDNGVDDDCDGTVDAGGEDPDDDGVTADGGDCAPDDATVHPGATETANGTDDDCDGLVDEGTSAYDDDGDGWSEDDGDCNDDDVGMHPSATEQHDGRDNDCDGFVDEGLDTYDDDGDGYTEEEGDCDDTDAATYPGADESIDGLDNDCDGDADEAGDDLDGDGYSEADGDCDDDDGWANPGQSEMCDGIDNDCDEQIDEGCGETITPATDSGKGEGDSGCACASTNGPESAVLLLGLVAVIGNRRRR